ncbi:ribonuclease H-like domain-containing protein [Tanacetum coccineum]
MGFISGTYVISDYLASAHLLEQWDRCHVFSDNAAKVWNELKDTYDIVNGSIKEFDIPTKLPDCTCEARVELVDHGKFLRLMQFLMGLDDVYQLIRSSILTMEILPEVKDAFVTISKEGSHRGMPANYVKTAKPQASAFVSRSYDNNRKRTNTTNGNWSNNNVISKEGSHRGMPANYVKTEKPQASAFVSRSYDNNRKRTNTTNGNWSNNNGNNVNRGNYENLLCKNYGLKCHTIDRCFEIIGYPPGFKRNHNLKPTRNFNNIKTNFSDTKGNNDVKTSTGTVYLTNDQVLKLISLFNDKSGSSTNAHMTANVSELNLFVGHLNGTLAKITHVGNLRLNSNVVLFDVLVIPEYTDLKKEKVLRTGRESAGLYLFDSDYASSAMCFDRSLNLSNIDHNGPCEVFHKAKQTREVFPLSEHKSTVFGELIHLDVWGPYKVVSREGYRLPSSFLNDKSPFSLIYGREPNLSHLRSFGCLCFAIVVKGSDKFSQRSEKCVLIGYASVPSDEEEGSPGSDGRVHQPVTVPNTYQPGHDETHPATPLDENNNSKGSVGTSDEVKYGLNIYANHCMLNSENYGFVSNLNKSVEPSSYEEALRDINWVNVMKEEMHALYENKTWDMTDLPLNRKPIGSK